MIVRRADEPLTCACGCGTPVKPHAPSNAARRQGRRRPYAHGHTFRTRKNTVCGLLERFWEKVQIDLDTGCWEWTGSRVRKGYARGYGRFMLDGQPHCAHVVAYEGFVGPVPEGLELDHVCRNRGCVNPGHLEPVTHAENMARSIRAMQTHCIRNHEFTPTNTYRAKNGTRGCRRCHADYERDRKRQQREATAA